MGEGTQEKGQRSLPRTSPFPSPDSEHPVFRPLGSKGASEAGGGACVPASSGAPPPTTASGALSAFSPPPTSPRGPPGPSFPQPLRPARGRASGARARPGAGCCRRRPARPSPLGTASGASAAHAVQVCSGGSAGGAAGRRSAGRVKLASPRYPVAETALGLGNP